MADIKVGDLVAVRSDVGDGTCPACLRGETNLCIQGGFIGITGGAAASASASWSPAPTSTRCRRDSHPRWAR